MDIQALTERESGARYGAIGGPWNRNGSPSMSPNYSKYFSLAPPFLLPVRFIKTKKKKKKVSSLCECGIWSWRG